MKRIGNIWEQVIAFDNLLLAFKKARKGKRHRPEVARFELELEKELFLIRQALQEKSWQPGDYRVFTIYERKARQISAAQFRDRVVHHALMNVVEPLLDKRFIYDSHACRKGHGVHLAVKRYQRWAKTQTYALKMDVSRYFPSIDHAVLKQQLARRIKDKNVLWLFTKIIDHAPTFPQAAPVYFLGDDLLTPLERSKGLPIGNLTSQFLANLYLDDLDHFIKETLRARYYLRYVDDLILLSNSKNELWQWQSAIAENLQHSRLLLHPTKVNLFRVRQGVDVLGYRVFPDYCLLRNDNGWRFSRRLRAYANAWRQGEMTWEAINPSVQSWIGHAGQADTLGLREKLFDSIVFSRGKGEASL